MTSTVPFELTTRAVVNGEAFTMHGTGTGSTADGTCSLHVDAAPGFPAGFDPISCPSICNHSLGVFYAQPIGDVESFEALTGGAYAVAPARRGLVYNQAGEVLLDLTVSGDIHVGPDVLVVQRGGAAAAPPGLGPEPHERPHP